MGILDKFTKKKEKAIKNKMLDTDAQIEVFKSVHVLQKDSERSYPVYVDLVIDAGGSDEIIATLGAEIKYKDEKPTLIIKNAAGDIVFEEVRPEALQYKIEETLEELELELSRINFILDEFKYQSQINLNEDEDEDDEDKLAIAEELGMKKVEIIDSMYKNLYKVDWELSKRELERKIDHLTSGEVKFVQTRNGKPHYMYELFGYFKLPIGKYNNKGLLKIPSIQSVDMLAIMTKIEIEQNKDDDKSLTLFGLSIGWIITVIIVIGAMWLFWKATGQYSEGIKTLGSMAQAMKELVVTQNSLLHSAVNETINATNSVVIK